MKITIIALMLMAILMFGLKTKAEDIYNWPGVVKRTNEDTFKYHGVNTDSFLINYKDKDSCSWYSDYEYRVMAPCIYPDSFVLVTSSDSVFAYLIALKDSFPSHFKGLRIRFTNRNDDRLLISGWFATSDSTRSNFTMERSREKKESYGPVITFFITLGFPFVFFILISSIFLIIEKKRIFRECEERKNNER